MLINIVIQTKDGSVCVLRWRNENRINRFGKIFEIVSGNKRKRNQTHLLAFFLNTWADGTTEVRVGGVTGVRETKRSYLNTT